MVTTRRIAEHSIGAVLAAADIAAVIGSYVKLARCGEQLRGLCPFHKEKTPSFYVHPKGVWRCHGCGAGGNVIGFVQRIEGLRFPEVIERLAAQFSIPLESSEIPKKRQALAYEIAAESELFWGSRYRTWTELLVDCYACLRQARQAVGREPGTDRDRLAGFLVSILPVAAAELERRIALIEDTGPGDLILAYRRELEATPGLAFAMRERRRTA